MAQLDPSERARRDEAVRVVRGFVPLYACLTALLFGPPTLRMAGIYDLDGGIQSLWSAGSLVLLVLAAAWIIQRLASLGQYRVGAGLRFDLLAAVTRGEYVPVGYDAVVPAPVDSPLAVLRADVAEILPPLGARGGVVLAETLTAGLAEAEAVARLLEIHDRRPEGLPVGEARGGIGRFTDHVLALRTDLQRGSLDPVAVGARLEADLRELRTLADTLRRGPPAAATGSEGPA